MYKPIDGLEYWIYRLCHNAPAKPRTATKFSYNCGQATSSASNHLAKHYSIGSDGAVYTAPSTPTISRGQSMLNGYCSSTAERNAAVEAFNYEIFKGLLMCFFVVE
jgi:hypothetical protein